MKQLFKTTISTTLLSMLCAAMMIPSMRLPVQAESKAADGLVRSVPVYRKSMSEKETTDCMFFDDLPDIPYMSLENYYKTFMDGTMTVESKGSGVYVYTEEKYGETAELNVHTDTLQTDDLAAFVSSPVFKKEGCGLYMDGPETMARVENTFYDRPATPVTVNYGKYQIDLREQDGVAYLPFTSLCDLFNNPDVITTFYRDGKIFHVSEYEENRGGEAYKEDHTPISWIQSGQRSRQMADFTYRELCLSIELMYGYPCTQNEFTDKMRKDGLDAALEQFDPEAKSLLLSEKSGEYLAGLYRLLMSWLFDGGHTGLMIDELYLNHGLTEQVGLDFFSRISVPDNRSLYYVEKFDDINESHILLADERKKLIGDEAYIQKGSTALIRFDEFKVDYPGWKSYFDGKQKTMPDDAVGTVYQGLQKAKQNGVKNVVFDLSTNLGGDSVALETICGFVLGRLAFNTYNTLGDQAITDLVVTDRNLDGVIDEKDDAVDYSSMHFAVLTSKGSFSCGNLMPSLFKDAGLMVLGEQSGGGTCSIVRRTTADGVWYCMSDYCKFINSKGEPVDDGVPVDAELTVERPDGSEDHSAFYDIEKLGERMDAFYADRPAMRPLEERCFVKADGRQQQNKAEPSQQSDNSHQHILLWVIISAVLAVIVAIAAVLIIIRKKKRKAPSDAAADSEQAQL